MKTYIFKFNKFGYDQYDSFVILAKDENDAIETLKKEYPEVSIGKNYLDEPYEIKETGLDWNSGYTLEEVKDEGVSRVLLGSFNAG